MIQEILITGMEGMAGSHLARAAVDAGFQVSGTRHPEADVVNIADLLKGQRVNLFDCDLTDKSNVRNLIYGINPDVIFHLAGRTNNPKSWSDDTLSENVTMLHNLLQEIGQKRNIPRLVLASTVNIYGSQTSEDPFFEDCPINPETPYALSKTTQEQLAFLYSRRIGLEVVVARFSQHTGPGRAPDFVEYEIGEQILGMERNGSIPHISVRNAAAEIDMLDVRDVAQAYLLLAHGGGAGEVYNVSSGHAKSVREIAQIMVAVSNVYNKDEVEISSMDSERFSPARYSNQKVLSIGWKPQITLRQTLEDFRLN